MTEKEIYKFAEEVYDLNLQNLNDSLDELECFKEGIIVGITDTLAAINDKQFSVCSNFEIDPTTSSTTLCKYCGYDKWQHLQVENKEQELPIKNVRLVLSDFVNWYNNDADCNCELYKEDIELFIAAKILTTKREII